jgi:hypothetical protein
MNHIADLDFRSGFGDFFIYGDSPLLAGFFCYCPSLDDAAVLQKLIYSHILSLIRCPLCSVPYLNKKRAAAAARTV